MGSSCRMYTSDYLQPRGGVCRLRFGDDEAYGEALELEDLGEAVMKEMTRQAGGCC